MSLKAAARALLVLLALSPSLAYAQYAENLISLRDLTNARAIALGGAYRVLGGTAEVVVGNPAAVLLYPIYRVEVGGAWDFASKEAFGSVMVLDGKSQPLGGGAAYQLVSLGRGGSRRTGHLSTIALAYALSPNFLLGASTRYLVMSGATSANAVTADGGLVLRLSQGLQIGIGGHNLIDTGNPELSRYFTGSGALMLDTLSLVADVRSDFNGESPQFGYSLGAEYILARAIPLRIGFRHEPLLGKALSGGLGLMAPDGGFDVAYQHSLDGRGQTLALTVTLNIQ